MAYRLNGLQALQTKILIHLPSASRPRRSRTKKTSPPSLNRPSNRRPTTDDDGRARTLTVTGLALLVNIMRIGRHRERPIIREDLDERIQTEARL